VREASLEVLEFPEAHAAIDYVLERQEGKRNVTPQDLSNARGKLYRRRKKNHGGDRKSEDAKSSGQNEHLILEGKPVDPKMTVREAYEILRG
jgi:hypothetical protein